MHVVEVNLYCENVKMYDFAVSNCCMAYFVVYNNDECICEFGGLNM